jgi:recombination protein RecA
MVADKRRRRAISKDLQEDAAAKPSPRKSIIDPFALLPTGSVMFNLALSDHTQGGFQKGKMANVIGDSSSGKTFLSLSCFAEANRLPQFDDHAFYYDDAEQSNEFDMEYLFGKGAADRVKKPVGGKDYPGFSNTIQDFWDTLTDLLAKEEPFIYVLDSLDSLDAEEDQKKVKEQKTARRKGTAVTGSYGMAKAKVCSGMFQDIMPKFKLTDSILIIISQTRDNIDPMSFAKKTRSGGNALKFYATHECWLANAGTIKKLDRDIGNNVKIKVTKNKVTGKKRIVKTPFFYDYGVDSIRGMIEFLVEEDALTKTKNTLSSEVLGISGTMEKFISQVEEGNLEEALALECQKTWNQIEESLKLNRKPKYQ